MRDSSAVIIQGLDIVTSRINGPDKNQAAIAPYVVRASSPD
jgi:hypothetical protein